MKNRKIKVIYMGTPLFALPPLLALLEDGDIEVQTVVTQEDKKAGRKQELKAPPVKNLALRYGIPVLQPPKLKGNAEIIKLIKGLAPDFIVVVAYGQILPPEILKIPKYGCVNLHASLLPKYRGASPVEESLLHGDAETGVTFIEMSEELDAGDILLIQRVHIKPDDNAETLRNKLSLLGASLLSWLLKDISEGLISPIPQNHAKATYCRKIRKEDGLIDLTAMTAREIVNRIKAYTPWPSCFLMVGNKRLKILEAADEDSTQAQKAKPGKAVRMGKDQVGIGTKKGLLLPKKVQLEGKNALSIQDFLRGNSDFFKNALASAK